MRRVTVLLLVLTLAPLAMPMLAQEDKPTQTLQVQYTGRLFGYYRMEPGETKHLGPVQQFLQKVNRDRNHVLLLGMGDNFAPEMGASLQLVNAGKGVCEQETENNSRDYPEALYKETKRHAKHAECDNVLKFLIKAGYRAVVPGREDFIYSSAWLTQTAGLLRQEHQPLSVLAANARVVFGKSKCPLLLSNLEQDIDVRVTCSPDGLPTKFEWLDRLDRVLARPRRSGGATSGNYAQFGSGIRSSVTDQPGGLESILANETRLLIDSLPPTQWAELRKGLENVAQADSKLSDKLFSAGRKDESDAEHNRLKDSVTTAEKELEAGVCKDKTSTVSNSICISGRELLDTHTLSRDDALKKQPPTVNALTAARDALLHSIYDEQKNIGFTEAWIDNGSGMKDPNVLIIGVLGQETMKAISKTNRTICLATTKDKDSKPTGKAQIVRCRDEAHDQQGELNVLNPQRTIEAIIEAAEHVHGKKYDYRILMAQMPRTEAEELVSRLPATADIPQIDLVLSEAQKAHATPTTVVRYQRDTTTKTGRWGMTPVLAALPTYDYDSDGNGNLLDPISTATLETFSSFRKIRNLAPSGETWSENGDSTTHLLMKVVAQKNGYVGKQAPSNCADQNRNNEDCKLAVIQYLLRMMQKAAHADVAMLERRDIFLGDLPKGYAEYEMCGPPANDQQACERQVALDRVLWKGDYAETVMLSGADVSKLMSAASNADSQERTLQMQDTAEEWVSSFGIVTQRLSNFSRSRVTSEEFWVTPWDECHDGSGGEKVLYCINGQPLISDHAYAVATSDYLAQESTLYPLSALPNEYHQPSGRFLTKELADAASKTPTFSDSTQRSKEEQRHQNRALFQIDVGKLVAGYSLHKPEGGDAYVGQNFQGAADSRANSPTQSELDLETKMRVHWRLPYVDAGLQSSGGYDRSFKADITGKKANASYPVNMFTVGPFFQIPLFFLSRNNWRNLSAGRFKLVLAPYQYQRQVNGSYLFSQQGTAAHPPQLRPLTGHSYRFGLRWEAESTKKWYRADKGSYFEAGGQYVLQDVASPDDPKIVKTLHTTGVYWDFHYQKAVPKLAKGTNLTVESQGDAFGLRHTPDTFRSQTRYDVPISAALVFPIFGNFGLAPTYSAFFYSNQDVDKHLLAHTFAITARWYFVRDASVGWRQFLFKGPGSADETKSAHMK